MRALSVSGATLIKKCGNWFKEFNERQDSIVSFHPTGFTESFCRLVSTTDLSITSLNKRNWHDDLLTKLATSATVLCALRTGANEQDADNTKFNLWLAQCTKTANGKSFRKCACTPLSLPLIAAAPSYPWPTMFVAAPVPKLSLT